MAYADGPNRMARAASPEEAMKWAIKIQEESNVADDVACARTAAAIISTTEATIGETRRLKQELQKSQSNLRKVEEELKRIDALIRIAAWSRD